MSQKIIGQRPIEGSDKILGNTNIPNTNANNENTKLINVDSFKNLIAKGTVPILFSSIIAEGTNENT